jgi:3-dehydroquinate synthase
MRHHRVFSSQIHFVQQAKSIKSLISFEKSFLIYDEFLVTIPLCKSTIEKFPFRYGVRGGESLKDIRFFSKHLKNIFKLLPVFSRGDFSVIAFGGGSVGDFAGFFASTLHRGVQFMQIPSTWLAAVDSAHGGKTALNFGGLKNQIGTFNFPVKTILHRDFLPQDGDRMLEASGEILKAAFLAGSSRDKILSINKIDIFEIWQKLPLAVTVKMRFVHLDPFEEKNIRVALNLGHTLAHAFERVHGLCHGIAVLFGLEFALNWSVRNRVLSKKDLKKISERPFLRAIVKAKQSSKWKNLDLSILLRNEDQIMSCIRRDKKRASSLAGKGRIQEIFITQKSYKIIGTKEEQFLKEIQRQRSQNEFLF